MSKKMACGFFHGAFDGKQVGRDEWSFNRSLVVRNNDGGGRHGAEDFSNFDVSDGEAIEWS